MTVADPLPEVLPPRDAWMLFESTKCRINAAGVRTNTFEYFALAPHPNGVDSYKLPLESHHVHGCIIPDDDYIRANMRIERPDIEFEVTT